MNIAHCNDLLNLKNIINDFFIKDNIFNDFSDGDDLKESIDIFLNEYLNNNVEIYKEYNF